MGWLVETGGVLLGQVTPAGPLITDFIPLQNQAWWPFTFKLDRECLSTYLSRADFLGLYHTHWLFARPSRRDRKTAQAFADYLGRPFWMGIHCRGWAWYRCENGQISRLTTHPSSLPAPKL